MVDIQSKEVIDKISEDLKIQPAMKIPRELMDKIQLVYDLNPRRIIKNAGTLLSNGTSSTIITASNEKDTYLVGASLGVIKDVLSTSTLSQIQATAKGSTAKGILIIPSITLTPQSEIISISFPPMLLERGSTVIVTNGTGTATIITSGSILFFEVDPQ